MRLTILTLTVLALSLAPLLSCSAIDHHHRQLVSAVHSELHESDPISGEWNVTFVVQDHNSPATFNLKLNGNKVTGTANSEHTGPGTVRDGKWEKNKLSFTLDFQKHESIAITGALQDSKLVGEFRTEGFVAKWEATRK